MCDKQNEYFHVPILFIYAYEKKVCIVFQL